MGKLKVYDKAFYNHTFKLRKKIFFYGGAFLVGTMLGRLGAYTHLRSLPSPKEYIYVDNIDDFKKIASLKEVSIEDVFNVIAHNPNIKDEYKEKMRKQVSSLYEKKEPLDLSLLHYNIQTLEDIVEVEKETLEDKGNASVYGNFNAIEHSITLVKEPLVDNLFEHEVTHMTNVVFYETTDKAYLYEPTLNLGDTLLEGYTSMLSDDTSYPVARLYGSLLQTITPSYDQMMNGGNINDLIKGLIEIKGKEEEAREYISAIDRKQGRSLYGMGSLPSYTEVKEEENELGLDVSILKKTERNKHPFMRKVKQRKK